MGVLTVAFLCCTNKKNGGKNENENFRIIGINHFDSN